MKAPALIAVMALTSTLVACGERDTPIKTNTTGSTATTSTAQTAPPAPPMQNSTAAATPSTHEGTPQAASSTTPGARDTKAEQPLKDLTKEEESSSMPKPGQVNNYSTTALDDANKGASNSSGAPASDAPKSDAAPTSPAK